MSAWVHCLLITRNDEHVTHNMPQSHQCTSSVCVGLASLGLQDYIPIVCTKQLELESDLSLLYSALLKSKRIFLLQGFFPFSYYSSDEGSKFERAIVGGQMYLIERTVLPEGKIY